MTRQVKKKDGDKMQIRVAGSLRRGDQLWEPLPKYDRSTRLEVIYIENKTKGIFCSPLRISTSDHMKDKNKYYEFHQDYEHYMVNYRNLYAQVMLLIKKGGLQHYVKKQSSQPSLSTQNDSARMEKGKTMMNIGEQNFRMVSVIIGKLEKMTERN